MINRTDAAGPQFEARRWTLEFETSGAGDAHLHLVGTHRASKARFDLLLIVHKPR